jgi:hypothetical protein
VPLLLSLATGSDAWRAESSLRHLAGRADLAAICADAGAPGRPWVLHATDEDVTEFASQPYAADAPRHVIAIRTPQAKLGVYSNWAPGGIEIQSAGREVELYDYSTQAGRNEIENVAGHSALEEPMLQTLEEHAIPEELRQPLPSYLHLAQQEGLADYQAVEIYSDERRGVAPPGRESEAQQEAQAL